MTGLRPGADERIVPVDFQRRLHSIPDNPTLPWILKEGGALDVDSCPDCWERNAHLERYAFAARACRGMRILDFGCGVGYGAELLAHAGNTVTAVDSSSEAISLARLRRGATEIVVFCEPGWDFDPFDACTAFEVIEHLDDPGKFIHTVKARHLICSVPVVPTLETNPHHKHDFTREQFRAMIEARYRIVTEWSQIRPFQKDPCIAVIHAERI